MPACNIVVAAVCRKVWGPMLPTLARRASRRNARRMGLGSTIGGACAVIVGDTSLRIGLGFQMAAANMKLRVGVFRDEPSAHKWLAPGTAE